MSVGCMHRAGRDSFRSRAVYTRAPAIYAYLENAAARYVALNVHVLRWVKRL